MQIKRVFTNAKFEKKFVQVGDVIYDGTQVLEQLPKLADVINKELQKQPTKADKIVKPFVYPDDEVMLAELDNKKQQIYKELNIQKPKTQAERLIYAGLIYAYLAKNLNYNQISQNERTLNLYSTKKYKEVVEVLRQKYLELNKDLDETLGLIKNQLQISQFNKKP